MHQSQEIKIYLKIAAQASLAQLVERKALNLTVKGSSPLRGSRFLLVFIYKGMGTESCKSVPGGSNTHDCADDCDRN
jgi:hypothetical protein